MVKVPDTINKSVCLGAGLNKKPNLSMSYLLIAECIISTAQQAKPKLKGHIELTLNQPTRHISFIVNHSDFILNHYNKTKIAMKKKLKNKGNNTLLISVFVKSALFFLLDIKTNVPPLINKNSLIKKTGIKKKNKTNNDIKKKKSKLIKFIKNINFNKKIDVPGKPIIINKLNT